MARYRTFTIGRSDDNDLIIRRRNVSRCHAELVIAHNGRAMLSNRSTSSETLIRELDGWTPIAHQLVSSADMVRFADFEISVRTLLEETGKIEAAAPPRHAPRGGSSGIEVARRDPRDGRIILS
jgi:pSer/pThr/pTyr-binding forkhead associated (FHA) protein